MKIKILKEQTPQQTAPAPAQPAATAKAAPAQPAAPAQAAPAQTNPQQDAQVMADAIAKIVTPIIQKAVADAFAQAQKGQKTQAANAPKQAAPAQAPATPQPTTPPKS